MKVVFVVPHLSTGGMPQYLNNKIEKIKDQAEIWVLEKTHEKTYNTVRLRIENQIGKERIKTWGKNPPQLLAQQITDISPDVIHFEEPCEQFVPDIVLQRIFTENRQYRIFETLHDSTIDPAEKRFLPDKFIVVSPWQVYLLQNLGVPMEVIEHELPQRPIKDKETSQKILGFDAAKKHVLQVGIFTPRKNQKETAEIAKSFPDVQFHFVGTLADNYKFYWESILASLPPNCKIWGERDDVDLFYQAADLVILPSIALFNDKETSPLVIKEALNWKTPLLLRNLSVYLDMFQESSTLKFMGSTHEETLNIMSHMLDKQAQESVRQLFDLRFTPEENKINICYNSSEELGRIFFSIKDRDSNSCIYGFNAVMNHVGSDYWCIPIPKTYFDFSGNKNFSGFKIEAYLKKEDFNPFWTGTIELRKPICKKQMPSFPSLNFEPTFINYTQFFVDWIYNGFFAGSRISKAIDIGSNIGLFTEWVLDRFGSDTEVIAVEPNKKAIESFKFYHGNKKNVKLEELAVTSKSGEFLEMNINPENSLVSSLEMSSGLNEKESVETITLLDLMKKHSWEECDLLKIDVEGGEYDIFQAIQSSDLRKFKFLLIEFHNNKGRLHSILKKMNDAKFSVDIRDDDTRYSSTSDSNNGTIFATRLD